MPFVVHRTGVGLMRREQVETIGNAASSAGSEGDALARRAPSAVLWVLVMRKQERCTYVCPMFCLGWSFRLIPRPRPKTRDSGAAPNHA